MELLPVAFLHVPIRHIVRGRPNVVVGKKQRTALHTLFSRIVTAVLPNPQLCPSHHPRQTPSTTESCTVQHPAHRITIPVLCLKRHPHSILHHNRPLQLSHHSRLHHLPFRSQLYLLPPRRNHPRRLLTPSPSLQLPNHGNLVVARRRLARVLRPSRDESIAVGLITNNSLFAAVVSSSLGPHSSAPRVFLASS